MQWVEERESESHWVADVKRNRGAADKPEIVTEPLSGASSTATRYHQHICEQITSEGLHCAVPRGEAVMSKAPADNSEVEVAAGGSFKAQTGV